MTLQNHPFSSILRSKHAKMILSTSLCLLFCCSLCAQPLDFLRKKNRDDFLPVHIAQPSIAKFMIEQDPTLLWEKDPYGRLPIHLFSCHDESWLFVQWMVKQDPKLLRAEDEDGKIPIQDCGRNIAEWMIGEDPSLIDVLAKSYHAVANVSPMLLKQWCEQDKQRLEIKDQFGLLPIHVAVEHSEELARWMIAENPSLLWARDDFGRAPIHVIDYSRISIGFLIWMVDQDPNLLLARDLEGRLPLHDFNRMSYQYELLERHLPIILRSFIEKCPALLTTRGQDGQSLLHIAMGFGDIDLAKWLVAQKKDLLYSSDHNGMLPIYFARNSPAIFKWMIGEDPNLLYATDAAGMTLIEDCYNTDLILWMIDRDKSLLSVAQLEKIAAEKPKEVLSLIRENDDLLKMCEKLPIANIAYEGDKDLLMELVNRDPFILDAQGDEYPPLIHRLAGGVRWRSADAYEKLKWAVLQDKSRLFQEYKGYLPMHFASLPLIKWMVKQNSRLISLELGYVQSLLFNGNSELVEWLIGQNPSLVNAVDERGDNLFHYAIQASDLTLAEKIYNKNSDFLKIKNHEGLTPFQLALIWSNDLTVQWMIQKDSQLLLTPDENGNYPIHLACYRDVEFIKWMLCQAPSQLYQRASNGGLPISFAIDKFNSNLIKWLIEQDASFVEETGLETLNTIYHITAQDDLLTFRKLFDIGVKMRDKRLSQ